MDRETLCDPLELVQELLFIKYDHMRIRQALDNGHQRFQTAGTIAKIRLEIELCDNYLRRAFLDQFGRLAHRVGGFNLISESPVDRRKIGITTQFNNGEQFT